ncbi:hypothetical protein EYF80_033070 [Liparis tanakae]|uniref:Uncharacterized protein n=1 Tax=Liparis tanakae TaxID=230148 RepID=A0A4Z2GUA3_9TELE|nr:hypothetical protein EYF80_033070 [Liparis tanakae]
MTSELQQTSPSVTDTSVSVESYDAVNKKYCHSKEISKASSLSRSSGSTDPSLRPQKEENVWGHIYPHAFYKRVDERTPA